MRTRIAVVTLLLVGAVWGPAWADLREYVQRQDNTFAFNLHNTVPSGPVTLYNLKLTSQAWHGFIWQHWLTVILPSEVAYPSKAMLFITGGNNNAPSPTLRSDRLEQAADIAYRSKSVVAVLQEVPNQPLFEGKVEDQIIAYTFDQYLQGRGEDWPLLLPMVKSAVRAMDAVQQFASAQFKQQIDGFLVSGASKRGWTTWLTGAVDPRVVAIAPMVIDVLNMPAQMEQQIKSYGRYSEEIEDYSKRDIQHRDQTAEGQRLNALVDPYSYRDSLTMPKLILLGTNDPYWTVDAANLYIHGLKGDTYLHYEPNAGHGLGPGAVPALLAFYEAILKGEKLPACHAEYLSTGRIRMQYADSPEVDIWMARAASRDFRHAKWDKKPIGEYGGVISNAGFSEMGYTAFFVDFVYTNAEGVTYALSSPIQVLPADRFPFDAQGVKIARPEPKGEPANNPYAPKM